MEQLGFSFDGVNVPGLFVPPGAQFVVGPVSGRNSLALDASLAPSVGRDGAKFIDASLPSRDITVDYTVSGDGTLASQRAQDAILMGALLSRGPRRLSFTDQPGRWYEGIFTGAPVKGGGHTWYSGQAGFMCPRPFLYGPAVTAVINEVYVAQTNYFVEPVWTVQAGADAPNGFTLTVNDQEFHYDGPVTSSTRVVVDSGQRETRIGGALRVMEASGVYPVLEEISAVSLSIPGSVSVKYQARWV